MLDTGLVSITFRQLSPKKIIELVAEAGLKSIEWGGDVHVQHGDLERAREVCRMTEDAGLKVSAYGSYYHVGCEKEEGLPFEKVLETACELRAPTIRVWAGNRGSKMADNDWWAKVIDETFRISEMAKLSGTTISFEYHGNTLTDTSTAAVRLMKQVGGDNTFCYWQPPVGPALSKRIEGLQQITPWLGNVHVFYWKREYRLPLAFGTHEWKKYLEIINSGDGDHSCLIEFVRNDDIRQFVEDAIALKQIIQQIT